ARRPRVEFAVVDQSSPLGTCVVLCRVRREVDASTEKRGLLVLNTARHVVLPRIALPTTRQSEGQPNTRRAHHKTHAYLLRSHDKEGPPGLAEAPTFPITVFARPRLRSGWRSRTTRPVPWFRSESGRCRRPSGRSSRPGDRYRGSRRWRTPS